MDPTASIRKLGFRKWYERELIKSHGALVTCFLCGLAAAAILEEVNVLDFGWRPLAMLLVVIGAIALAWASWRSYATILERAEFYGERSICPQCHTYGRFTVLATGVDAIPGRVASAVAPLQAAWMRVQCRTCGTTWRMPE